ncbi:MAG: hypothetical protein OEW15_17345 [Nitrospirota bacterium]|nr:hypothetical protein [Nitrospirota bacterium]
MRCLQALVVFLVMVATAYLVLRVFSRLFGLDVQQVLFSQIRQKEFIWPSAWAFLFLIGFVPLLALLQTPFTAITMTMTHEGAMLGYPVNDQQAMFYEPQHREYGAVAMNLPPRAASSFKDTFETVVYFRPYLTGTYQSLQVQSYRMTSILLIVTAFSFGMLYLITFKMVGEHLQKQRPPARLTVQAISENCTAWTGYSLPAVVTAVAVVMVLVVIVSGYLANRIRTGYDEKFAELREGFRSELMSVAAPGKTIKGRVVNRVRHVQSHSRSRDGEMNDRTVNRVTEVHKYSLYTIEFRKLLRYDPVYLQIMLSGDADTTPQIKLLDAFFPPDGSPGADGFLAKFDPRDARDPREIDFVVNDDYSVSLAKEQDW